MRRFTIIAALVLMTLATLATFCAAAQTPPEAKELEALLADTLIQRGRITGNDLVFSETEIINGEQGWAFHSPSSGYYAVSETGIMYIFVQVDYITLEEFYGQADSLDGKLEKLLTGAFTADVTGENVNIRNEPNTKGDVLLKVSESAGNVVVVEKKVVKDKSGDWYKVLYYYDDGMFMGTYVDAYIFGKYIKIRNISEDEKSALRFRLDRD